MYAEINGERYALDSVIAENGVSLVFSDTPIDEVDRIALRLPENLLIRSANGGVILYEFEGYTVATSIHKNPANKQVLLSLRRPEDV